MRHFIVTDDDLTKEEITRLVALTETMRTDARALVLQAIRRELYPLMIVQASPTGELTQKPMRFGCPNGHNSEYTVFGAHNHTCAACGATHTLTDVPEDPPSALFGTTIKATNAQE